MEKLVSVIVPIYNVEKYLQESIESILKQTYTNLEIILINDGSKDQSGKICEQYAKLDNRIRVYHIQNQGVSHARNYGIENAHGEYVYFFDPDDSIEINTIEVLVDNIRNTDMVICGFVENYKNNKIAHPITLQDEMLSSVECIDKLFDRKYFCGYLWNKLFKTKAIKQYSIRFEENIKILEDLIFVSTYLLKINDVKIISKNLYYYRMRKSSAVWNDTLQLTENLYDAYSILNKILEKNNIKSNNFNFMLSWDYARDYKVIKRNNFKINEELNLRKKYISVLKCKDISLKKKIKLCIRKNFYVIYKIYMIKKISKNQLYD